MQSVLLKDLVWPYRPDLLIRIDFIDWWQGAKRELWADVPEVFTAANVQANVGFFAEAKRHPYFAQYTRKKRYWKRPLPLGEAEPVYADGVARFLNLLSGIQRCAYDPRRPIGLHRPFIQLHSGFGQQHMQRWFIGDGCHRFACLAWLDQGKPLAPDFFRVTRVLVHRPVDWRAILARLGVVNESEFHEFERLFSDSGDPPWDALLSWTRRVRERFATLDLHAMFELPVV